MSILLFFVGTIVLVMVSIEAGLWLGQATDRHPELAQESTVSAIEGSVLALLAFILAFTFGIASNRLDARKELVRSEANAIRTVWYRSDFLPEPDRTEAKRLLREYVHARASAFRSAEEERIESVIEEAERIQGRLWAIAVSHARQDMPTDIGALYLESLNDMSAVHASRIAMGLQLRIPPGIWLTLATLTVLGMLMVGYQAGIAKSRRTLAMPTLAVAFACVVALISSLDQPIGGFTFTGVSQQPLVDLLSDIDSQRLRHSP